MSITQHKWGGQYFRVPKSDLWGLEHRCEKRRVDLDAGIDESEMDELDALVEVVVSRRVEEHDCMLEEQVTILADTAEENERK